MSIADKVFDQMKMQCAACDALISPVMLAFHDRGARPNTTLHRVVDAVKDDVLLMISCTHCGGKHSIPLKAIIETQIKLGVAAELQAMVDGEPPPFVKNKA